MSKGAYYNEFNPENVEWLKELIKRGLIAPGDVDGRSITDVHPEDLKGYTQHHFFAGIGVWSHALRKAGWSDDVPVCTASLPCFPAGTLVLTKRGHIPIEEIKIGDFVLTHKGRWRVVTNAWCEGEKPCVRVKGQGHYGMVCTPNHPFLTDENEWVPAEFLEKKRWRNISFIPSADSIPDFVKSANITRGANQANVKSLEFAKFLGYWVGDGWAHEKVR